MKKLLFCMVLSIMMLSVLPAYAETTTYTPDENGGQVSSAVANGKKTVLIKNAETDTIVYVNQAETDSPFTEATPFLIKKETPADGMYTIILGGDDGQNVTSTFYIGMNANSGDVKMVRRTNKEDQIENGVRYACSVSGAKEFKTVIIKMGGEYYGFNAPEGWSVSGDASSVLFGVEITAGEGDDITQITDVWLSERALDNSGILSKDKPTSSGQTE